MKLQEVRLIGATTAGGAATILSDTGVFGRLIAVYWDDGTLADGVDAVLSYTNTVGDSVTLLTLTDANVHLMYYPREQVHDNTGAALWYEAANSEMVAESPIVAGALKLVIAAGGATKTGGAYCYIEEMR